MGVSGALDAAVAGRWYPAAPDKLAALVDRLLADAGAAAPPPADETAALIAPHAGFAYSGAVAASAFTRLSGRRFDRILLLGPSHYFAFDGAAVPDPGTAGYRTPLGEVPIDRAGVALLSRSRAFTSSDRFFAPEHALEAELPFLQRTLDPATPIVPILLGGTASSDDASAIAEALAPLAGSGTLIVVSSDFTHFGPRFDYVPFTDDVPRRIRELDHQAIRAIEAGDASAFAEMIRTTGATVCGHRAIEVLLRLPGREFRGQRLEYDTSGNLTGAWDHSVSYAALALTAR